MMRKIAAAVIYLTSASAFGRGAVVLSGILVSRQFGAEAFALFAFVHITATSVSNIAMLGLMNGLPRFIARMEVDPSSDALSRAVIGILVVSFGLIVAVVALAMLPDRLIGLPKPEAKGVLLALTFTIGLNNLLMGINNGLERFSIITWSTLAMGGILICGVALAVATGTQSGTLLAYLIATIMSTVLLLRSPWRVFRQRLSGQPVHLGGSNLRAVRNYIGPMFLATILTSTGLWLAGRSLLGRPEGAQAFAEFALGQQWFGLASMARLVVAKAVLPRLTHNAFLGDMAAQRSVMARGVLLSLGGALAILVAVVLFSPYVLSLYGPELSGARWSLILFVLAAVVSSPISVLNSSMIADERYTQVLKGNVVWWIVVTSGSFLLRDYGATAVACVVVISYCAFLGITLAQLSGKSGIRK